MNKLLDIDYLKANCQKIHFFGLGFIQLKLNDKERLHYYVPELPNIQPMEEVHNHRYDFTSTLLLGKLEQRIFSVTPGGNTMVCRPVSCDPTKKAPDLEFPVQVTGIYRHTLKAWDSYRISHEAYHTVDAKEATITHVVRGPYITAFANVVRSKYSPELCPFRETIQESVLWEWVQRLSRWAINLESLKNGNG